MLYLQPRYILLFLTGLFGTAIYAQHQKLPDKPAIWRGHKAIAYDTNSLLYAFKNGTTHGHFRYYFMATDNDGALTDYFANAFGGGLRYETQPFYGFGFGISGFYIFNIGSSNLQKHDPATNAFNRYEIQLFDIMRPDNTNEIDRLEELFLKYHFGASHITFGRQLINTPFINLQDGRMRPTGVEGLWLDLEELPKTRLQGGVIYAVSPRATTRFFRIGESIGVFPSGFHTDGTPSRYAGNTHSKYVAMLGGSTKLIQQMELQMWNMYVDNIFNTAMIQADFTLYERPNYRIFTGAQYIRQDGVGNGGNEVAELAYFERNGQSNVLSSTLGVHQGENELSINYTRITKHGRFIMPREWGREPFYTFIPRERNEGFGDLHAVNVKYSRHFRPQHIFSQFTAGFVRMPDPEDTRLNKYKMPSYIQLNADFRYSFTKFFRGLDAQVLVVSKLLAQAPVEDMRLVINKVNMMHYNLILNYHF